MPSNAVNIRPRSRSLRGAALGLLLAMAAGFPFVLHGAFAVLATNSNDVRQWLPEGFEEAAQYDWFLGHFSRDEIAVVCLRDGTLGDPRLARLAESLLAATDNDGAPLFARATTGSEVVDRLTDPPLNLTQRQALARLRGALVGADGQTTALLLTVSASGAKQRPLAVERIYEVARRELGLAPADVYLGGPTVDSATIDVESQRSLTQLAGLTAGLVFLLTWQQLSSLRLAFIVLLEALYSTGLSLAIVWYTGGTMNLALIMLPTLTYVLNISGAVHLVNYYRDALDAGRGPAAPLWALTAGWKPCVLAALTTAIGLGSLGFSKIVPIRMFGIYAALATLASVPILLGFIPTALACWPARRSKPQMTSGEADRALAPAMAGLLDRFRVPALSGCLIAMVLAGAGLSRINSTVKLQDRFATDSRILSDYRWLETHLGPLVPMEVVVHIPHVAELSFLERLELIGRLHGAVSQLPAAGGTISTATFAPVVPQGSSTGAITRRTVLARKLEADRSAFFDGRYLVSTGDEQLWRISTRIEALNDIDYGYFVETLRTQLAPVVAPFEDRGVRLTFTGVIPLLYKAQRQLLDDLIESFLVAFAIIAVVMMFVLRNVTAGLLVMLPNVFPAIVVFGAMGWLGLPVQTGSVMTASISLGIAVDDSLHFLTWFRRGAHRGLSQCESVAFAYGHCARAMVNTTLICGLGVIVFTFSSFMPNVRFAWLLTTLLFTALAADLILLPVMLLSRVGKRFMP